MTFLLPIMLLGLIPAFIAQSKGRSAFAWWIYGALLFIIALPHALLLSPVRAAAKLVTLIRRPCPHCAEDILPAATICPFCKMAVEPRKLCGHCQTLLPIEVHDCAHCGSPCDEAASIRGAS